MSDRFTGVLDQENISEYFHRSYFSADGLWFMKVEEEYGFDVALELDRRVWLVMPKIQARFLKSKLDTGNGIEALLACLATKLSIEGFAFEVKKRDDGFDLIVADCPWHNLRVKAGRAHISGIVGEVICHGEYSAWASEFGAEIRFEQGTQICKGSEGCTLRFTG